MVARFDDPSPPPRAWWVGSNCKPSSRRTRSPRASVGMAHPQDNPHPWRTAFAAHAEVWSDVVTRWSNSAWWSATCQTTPEELTEWGDAPLSMLSHVLQPWPGST